MNKDINNLLLLLKEVIFIFGYIYTIYLLNKNLIIINNLLLIIKEIISNLDKQQIQNDISKEKYTSMPALTNTISRDSSDHIPIDIIKTRKPNLISNMYIGINIISTFLFYIIIGILTLGTIYYLYEYIYESHLYISNIINSISFNSLKEVIFYYIELLNSYLNNPRLVPLGFIDFMEILYSGSLLIIRNFIDFIEILYYLIYILLVISYSIIYISLLIILYFIQ